MVVPLEMPIKARGGLAILRGNLAPEGCVLKLAGDDRTVHRGPARVFDSEEATFAAVKAGQIAPGDVVVIRYEGPVGGPGCARCSTSRARSSAKGCPTQVALDHRRPLLRGDARLHGRPRRSRGIEARPARGRA